MAIVESRNKWNSNYLQHSITKFLLIMSAHSRMNRRTAEEKCSEHNLPHTSGITSWSCASRAQPKSIICRTSVTVKDKQNKHYSPAYRTSMKVKHTQNKGETERENTITTTLFSFGRQQECRNMATCRSALSSRLTKSKFSG